MPILKFHLFHHVKSNRKIKVRWIKKHYIINTIIRNKIKQFLCSFSVRINIGQPITILNVLNRHIFHQIRFSHTSFSNRVKMTTTIILLNTKTLLFISERSEPKISYFAFLFHILFDYITH